MLLFTPLAIQLLFVLLMCNYHCDLTHFGGLVECCHVSERQVLLKC